MQQATWPGPVWPEAELLDMVGRIVSNNFGIYTSRQRQQPHHSLPNAQEDDAPAGQASSSSALQSTSSLHSGSSSEEATGHLRGHSLPNAQENGAPAGQASSRSSSAVQSASNLHFGSSSEEATGHSRGHLLPLATSKLASFSQNVMPWPLQADTEQLVRSVAVSPLHSNSTADVCDTQHLFPALDSAVGALSVDGPAQGCIQQSNCKVQSKSSSTQHTEAEPSLVQRGRAAGGIQKAKEDVIGREMYITASFFNHSCEPNCIKKRVHGQHSGLALVTALRDIKVNALAHPMHLFRHRIFVIYLKGWCHPLSVPFLVQDRSVTAGCLQIISCIKYQQ